MRQLVPGDIDAMMRLKQAASWNQTEADLRRNLTLEPEGCFAVDCEGQLASTATVISYGHELAWLGMVLTDPKFRGRGFARQLFTHTLEYLDSRGVIRSKLDATSMGEPLYRSFGFEAECVIERWVRVAQPNCRGSAGTSPIADVSLDRKVFAADRSALLTSLASEGCIDLGQGQYAMGRPGSNAAYFGPMVATGKYSARRGLEWLLQNYGRSTAYWDLFPGNAPAVELAREYGFEPARQLVRMRRGAPDSSDIGAMYAIAGFEYG